MLEVLWFSLLLQCVGVYVRIARCRFGRQICSSFSVPIQYVCETLWLRYFNQRKFKPGGTTTRADHRVSIDHGRQRTRDRVRVATSERGVTAMLASRPGSHGEACQSPARRCCNDPD